MINWFIIAKQCYVFVFGSVVDDFGWSIKFYYVEQVLLLSLLYKISVRLLFMGNICKKCINVLIYNLFLKVILRCIGAAYFFLKYTYIHNKVKFVEVIYYLLILSIILYITIYFNSIFKAVLNLCILESLFIVFT